MPTTLVGEDEIPLYYEVRGEGPTIVFVHPPGMGSITFKQQRALAKKYQLIMYDMRGNGQSGNSMTPITIPLLAKDLYELIQSLGIDQIVLCGYSNGGSVALEFALTYPEKVIGLVLIGGFSEVNSFLLENEFKLGIIAAQAGRISLLANVIGRAHGSSKGFSQELVDYYKLSDQRSLYDMYVEGLQYSATARLDLLKAPLLLVYGSKDYYVHAYHKIFERHVPQTEVVYISNTRHQVPTKKHIEFNSVINDFIERKVL